MDYTELVAAVQDYLVQDDISSTNVDTFIELCEAKLNRELRHTLMTQTHTDTLTTTGKLVMPADFIELVSHIVTATPSITPEYYPPNELALMQANMTPSRPVYYTLNTELSGTDPYIEMSFAPLPSESFTYNMKYIADLPSLSSGQTTNWLVSRYPDVYLYGCLLEAAPFLVDDARIQTWGAMFAQSKASVMTVSQRGQNRPGARMHSKAGIKERRRNARY